MDMQKFIGYGSGVEKSISARLCCVVEQRIMFVIIGRYDLRWQKVKFLRLFVQLLLECKSILYYY